MLMQLQVQDFDMWYEVYLANADLRADYGAIGTAAIFQTADNPNHVVLVAEWDSFENAKAFTQAPELRAAMQQAGVSAPPSVTFLNEV